MVLCRDSATGALGPPHRPVLLEGSRPVDRWLVGTCADVDVVGITIRCHGALLGSTAGGVVGAKVLDNVAATMLVVCTLR